MRKGHLDDLMKKRTRKFDGFHCIVSGQGTHFNQCKLFNVVVPNEDIVLIAADTRRNPILSDGVSFFVNCFESAQELFVVVSDLEVREIDGDLVEVALLSDQVNVQIIIECRDGLHDDLIPNNFIEFKCDRLHFLS